jgi:hypothetical protein
VVVALVAGALVTVFANPAQAAPPTVSISVSNGSLSPGETATVRIRIENENDPQEPGNNRQTATVRVSTSFGELTCSQNCDGDVDVDPGESEEITARVTAGNVADGQTKSGQVIVQATINGESAQATRDMTVRGRQVQQPPQPQTVRSISGKVTNQSDGKAVNGAYVALSDGASKLHETFASANGTFRFEGSAQKPIAPGRITIGASKDDKKNTKTINVNANQSVSGVVITLQIEAAPTESATPVPTEDAPLDEEPTDEASSDGALAVDPASNADDGGGFGNWLVVLGGGLLVAFGVGGIVWVMLRRKENDDPEDETSTTGVRPAVPMGGAAAYRGGDDATRIAAPGGPIADAPTMLHTRPPIDEFPDPYGAPMPPQAPGYGQPGWDGGAGYGGQPTRAGGYDQATQMYNGAAPTQFGNAPGSGGGYGAGGYPDAPGSGAGGYGGAPSSGGGYGATPGGYPPAGGGYGDRFDEPTGRYEPASGGGGYGAGPNGYGAGPNGYGGAPNGYGDERGYGAQPNGYDEGGNGYGGQRGGYEGGYGAAPAGGYDETRGYPAGGEYGRGGYEGGGAGYDRVPEQRGGGAYGGPNGGYDDRGDYYQGRDEAVGRTRHGGRDRRELGWLDD